MLKLFRRIEPAPNPEFEIGRFLTAARLHADAGAGRRARVPAARPRAGHARRRAEARSSTREPAGTSRSTSCAATTSASPRAQRTDRQQAGPALDRLDERPSEPPMSRRRFSRRSNSGISRARRRSAAGPRSCTRAGRADRDRLRAASRWIARPRRARGSDARARRARRSTCSRSRSASLNEASRVQAEAVLAAARRAARAVRRDPRARRRRAAHPDPRRLPPRAGAADRGGFRHPRLRGRSGAIDRRAAGEAVAAQGRRRDDPFVQLRRVRGAVRVRRARARRLRRARAVGRNVGSTGPPTRS